MSHLISWLNGDRFGQDGFDHQRQAALNVFTILGVLLGVLYLILSITLLTQEPGIHLKQVGAVLFIMAMLVLSRFNRQAYQPAIGLACLVAFTLAVAVMVPLRVLDRTLVAFGLITFTAGFISAPAASYLLAAISVLAYSMMVLVTPSPPPYNWISLSLLLLCAFFGNQVAHRLRTAMNKAGVNETRYFELANSNPAFMYILENGHRGKWIYANPQITNLLGFDAQEWVNTPGLWERQLFIHDRERIFTEEARCRGEVLPFHAEYRLLTRTGQVVWVSDHVVRVSQSNDNQVFQGVMLDITQRKRADQVREATYAISQSAYTADNLDALYERIHHILGTLIRAENFFIAMYDDKSDIVSFPYFVDEYDTAPAPRPVKRSLTDYVIRTGKPVFASPQVFNDLERAGRVETTGTPSIDWLGVPLKVKDRTIGAMVVQSYHEGQRFDQEALDILTFISTQVASAIERKRAEETIRLALAEKEVLVREVHHRVKNNLQVILGLLSLQSDAVDDPRVNEVIRDIRTRISSMALVHEELYQSSDLARVNVSEYFQLLVDHLVQVYREPRIQISLDAGLVLMAVDKAIPCGLILNELVSNAMKYAFPEDRSGQVNIFLAEEESEGENKSIVMRVRDTGTGLPAGVNLHTPESFGLQIVNILVKQLKGRLTAWNENGAVFEVRFPVQP